MSGSEVSNYAALLGELKEKIQSARIRAVLSVNKELLQTYWDIGNVILQQQKREGWGTKIIERLGKDLKTEFPDFQGLSIRNIKYMRAFAEAYPSYPAVQEQKTDLNGDISKPLIVQAPLAQLTWYHHITLLDKVKDHAVRLFYIFKTIENGWSRNTLVHQIENGLHIRQGSLITNFNTTIAPEETDLLQQIFKDPYNFDFLQITEKARERDLENALIQHIKKFLLELGDGFAFMGQQFKMKVEEKEYILDLLFYHTKLRRYIVIDLKIGDFEAEFIGKMNLYLGVADDTLKGIHDEDSIGLILCKTKDKVIAEYALRDTSKPIGISEYKISQALPESIKGELPTIEELEQKMDEELHEDSNPIAARLKAIKNKLKNIAGEEIQTPMTFQILTELYHKGLRPLYKLIIERFGELNELFHDFQYEWYHGNRHIADIQQLDENWEKERENSNEVFFDYKLLGFRKAGTENYSTQIRLKFEVSTYWYGLSVANDNNNQPFLKKLYHQGLTEEDRLGIVTYIGNKMLDQIEWIVRQIEAKVQ